MKENKDLDIKNVDIEITNSAVRKASIKETGEELSAEEWARFDAAVAQIQAERRARQAREYAVFSFDTESSDAR